MRDYRLYFLDRNGHIGHALTFACEDDAEALQRAESYRDGRDMELWQQARLVRALPAEQIGYLRPSTQNTVSPSKDGAQTHTGEGR